MALTRTNLINSKLGRQFAALAFIGLIANAALAMEPGAGTIDSFQLLMG